MSIHPSTMAGSIRMLLRKQCRDELLRTMSPERRATYQRIRELREKIGPIDFHLAHALRE